MSTARPYGGRTLDERREARRALLVETGLDCLHSEGLSGISVRTVCSRSKLTPRYFYESFANLDELLVALVDEVGDEVRDRSLAAMRANPDDVETQTRTALAAVFQVVLSDPRKASVLLASSGHEAMQARQQERFLEYAELAIENLSGVSEQTLDLDRLRPVFLFLVGGAVELVSAQITGMVRITEAELVDHCARLFVAALQTIPLLAAGSP